MHFNARMLPFSKITLVRRCTMYGNDVVVMNFQILFVSMGVWLIEPILLLKSHIISALITYIGILTGQDCLIVDICRFYVFLKTESCLATCMQGKDIIVI